jgi:LacI family transcriptional regulator
MVIGFVFPGFNAGHFYADIFHGIESFCMKNNYGILIGNTNSQSDKEEEIIKLLEERRVDGIILAPTMNMKKEIFEKLDNDGVPYVFLDKYIEGISADRIIIDNEKGAYIATEYLIDKGYKKIAFLSGPEYPCITIKERLKGYRNALEVNNMEYSKVIKTDKNIYNQRKSGFDAVNNAIKEGLDVDAIFAINDSLAIGAMRALRDKDIKISEDIAVVGFNEDDISKYLEHPLTTVSVPKFDMGYKAAKMLIERIENNGIDYKEVKVEPKLRIRETS